jgi:predicted transcriptional regulator
MTEPKAISDFPPGEGRSDDPAGSDGPPVAALGHREREVLSVVRHLGSATVQQVAGRLSAGLAYTTVMTTLDRLFRKGLLERHKQNRAFLYSVVLSARDLEDCRAAQFVRRFFSESEVRPEILVSSLVDAVHRYDTDLLNQLESSIRSARAAQSGQSAPAEAPPVRKKEGRR